jgi:hypothetical protein
VVKRSAAAHGGAGRERPIIAIHTTHGKIPLRVREVRGVWALHRLLDSMEAEPTALRTVWTVTHIPSGMRLPLAGRLREVRELFALVARRFPEYGSAKVSASTKRRQLRELQNICRGNLSAGLQARR